MVPTYTMSKDKAASKVKIQKNAIVFPLKTNNLVVCALLIKRQWEVKSNHIYIYMFPTGCGLNYTGNPATAYMN